MKENSDISLLEIQVASKNEEKRKLIQEVIRTISDSDAVPSLDNYELYLILDEAITNAMEHGNRWDAAKKVTIKIQDAHDKLLISVQDEGLGFDTSSTPKRLTVNGTLNTRGRGLFIIKNFVDVFFNTMGNEITIIVPVDREG